jgi:hypothetical protein
MLWCGDTGSARKVCARADDFNPYRSVPGVHPGDILDMSDCGFIDTLATASEVLNVSIIDQTF